LLLPPLALLGHGGLFSAALHIAALLLRLEIGGGLSGLPLADLGSGSLLPLRATPAPPSGLVGSQVGREI